MKKRLSLILAAVMCICMANIVLAAEFKFTDVPASQWYYENVKSAVEMGLINGKSETTYCPDDNLTYAEAIKLAACMNQLYNDGVITLKNGNPWYQSYVDYCVNKGIIDKEYNYTENATRAGYMGIFAKALPDEGLKAINNVPDDSIPDVPSARAYAQGVYKLYRAGILQGVDDAHNCSPLANIKRSEVATILVRMMDATKRVEFSMGAEEEKPEEEKPEEEKPEEAKPLAIKTQPVAVSANVGETATLTVEVEGGKAPYTYQWRNTVTIVKTVTTNFEDSETVSGATTNVLSLISDVKKTYNINCEITDAEGTKIYTDTVTVSFNGSSIKDKFDDDDTALEKSDFKLVVDGIYVITGHGLVVTGKVASGMLEVGDVVGFYDESGIYNLADASVTGIEMFNKLLPDCEKGDNVGLRITLDPEEWKDKLVEGMVIKFEREPYAIAIKTQPTSVAAKIGVDVEFTVEAQDGVVPYKYQWQVKDYASDWENVNAGWIPSATSATLSFKVHQEEFENAYQYRCIVTDGKGNSVTTDAVKVNDPGATTPLAITSQSENSNATYGAGIVSIEVKAAGGKAPYTYQWYQIATRKVGNRFTNLSVAVTDDGTKIVGAQTANLKRIHTAAGTYVYFCEITDADGNKVKSDRITITCDKEASGGRGSIPTGKGQYFED